MSMRIKAFLMIFLPVAFMIGFTSYLAGWFLNTIPAQGAVAFGIIAITAYGSLCAYSTWKS